MQYRLKIPLNSTTPLIELFNGISSDVTALSLSENFLGRKGFDELCQAIATLPIKTVSLDLYENELWLHDTKIAQILASITVKIKTLFLEKNKLNRLPDSALATVLSAIPTSVTHLSLAENDLGYINQSELDKIWAAIPTTVDRLNLNINNFGNSSDPLSFETLPKNVTTILLEDNKFYQKSGIELAHFFTTMRAVQSLDLSYNKLGLVNDLATALASIPATVTSLDLSSNHLGNKTADELGIIFASIPKTVKVLNLSNNNLGKIDGTELARALANFSSTATVTSLSLNGNNLGNQTADKLAKIFASIPKTVKVLDLSYNDLGKIDSTELAQALSNFSPTAAITSLDLRGNNLGNKTADELAIIFASIPKTVKVLNLSNNNLGNIDGTELARALANLPPGIRVNLANNKLFKNKTREKKDAFLTTLAPYYKALTFDLTKNGESDGQRAIAPLVSLAKKTINARVPPEVIISILSYLLPEKTTDLMILGLLSRAERKLASSAYSGLFFTDKTAKKETNSSAMQLVDNGSHPK